LKVQYGSLRALAEDPVFSPGVEPEEVEAGLECPDVVSSVKGISQIQNAIAERVASLYELVPRVVADLAVHHQPAPLLELPDASFGARSELAVLPRVDEVAEAGQPSLDVSDRFAASTSG